jgi:hypothetical protein
MVDKVAERVADNAIHWAARRFRCPNRNITTAIHWNPQPHKAIHRRLCRAENAHSSNSLRRESLYPAELSGLDHRIVELTACSIEVLKVCEVAGSPGGLLHCLQVLNRTDRDSHAQDLGLRGTSM